MEYELSEFGSEEWLSSKLFEIVSAARDAAEGVYNNPSDVQMKNVDFDSYTYIKILSKSRKLWNRFKMIVPNVEGVGIFEKDKLIYFHGMAQNAIMTKALEHAAHLAALKIFLNSDIPSEILVHFRG